MCQYSDCSVVISGEATVDAVEGKSQSMDLSSSQHVLVCALHELGCLVLRLGSSASPLVQEPATGESIGDQLIHLLFY